MAKVEKEGWVGDLFSWLGTKLSSLWSTAEPAVVSSFRAFIAEFEGDAIAAVAEEWPLVKSGTDKFDAAVAKVTAKIIVAGWTATVTAIETLIQDAYISYKAAQPETHGLVTPPNPALQK